MNQNKIIGIGLLVGGAIALYFGFNAANAPVNELTESVTGEYTDSTMLYFIGGGAAAVAGLFMLSRK